MYDAAAWLDNRTVVRANGRTPSCTYDVMMMDTYRRVVELVASPAANELAGLIIDS